MKLIRNGLIVSLLFVLSLILSQDVNAGLYIRIAPQESSENTYDTDSEKLCKLHTVGTMSADGVRENLLEVDVSKGCIEEIKEKVEKVETKNPDSQYFFNVNGVFGYRLFKQKPDEEIPVMR